MGVADALPGISGGTVALIAGIYGRLIRAIGSLGPRTALQLLDRAFWRSYLGLISTPMQRRFAGGDPPGGHVAFLSFLGIGLVLALLVAAAQAPALLERYPREINGLFLGLVLASALIPLRMISRWSWVASLCIVAGALLAFWSANRPEGATGSARGWATLRFEEPLAEAVTFSFHNTRLASEDLSFSPDAVQTAAPGATELRLELRSRRPGASGNLAAGSIDRVLEAPVQIGEIRQTMPTAGGRDPALFVVFLAGAAAASAILLPGVSGAFVLLMLGLYHYMTHALRVLLAGEWDRLAVVALFSAGIAAGLAGMARLLRRLLDLWPNPTLGVLAGLMVGSARGLWPFMAQGAGGRPVLGAPDSAGPILWIIGGAAFALLIARAGHRRSEEGPGRA